MRLVQSLERKTAAMQLPKILVSGRFTADDLIISLSESNRKIHPAIEAKLRALWEEKLKKAQANG